MQETLEVLPLARRESSPPSVLEAQIPLKVILANLTIDFAVSKLLLVGVLLDEACFQLRVTVHGWWTHQCPRILAAVCF